ncbi:hypothetical protein [Pseudoalteromonas phage J2-1_QLiu-2017]|nr:hypothetical protein [Pseudoalteromonas phage J2-1_QLiu-2017]
MKDVVLDYLQEGTVTLISQGDFSILATEHRDIDYAVYVQLLRHTQIGDEISLDNENTYKVTRKVTNPFTGSSVLVVI